MLLLNSERIGHLVARSLENTSTELVSCTIERSNISKLKTKSTLSFMWCYFSVFNAKLLPANTTLNDVQFPGETKLNFSDVRGLAQIAIPSDILYQFTGKWSFKLLNYTCTA